MDRTCAVMRLSKNYAQDGVLCPCSAWFLLFWRVFCWRPANILLDSENCCVLFGSILQKNTCALWPETRPRCTAVMVGGITLDSPFYLNEHYPLLQRTKPTLWSLNVNRWNPCNHYASWGWRVDVQSCDVLDLHVLWAKNISQNTRTACQFI